jgi:DNA invertase Pin-like site-specific DNA recombinase
MIVGYARVSTDEQRLDLQLQALERAGCDKVYTDHGHSGSKFNRPGLEQAITALSAGDTLVVWRLDRLGRSLSGLVGLMDQLGRRGVHFHSVTESINTASSGGRLMFHMMAALAEFERAVISERTRAGLSAARARGKQLGRPRALSDEQVQLASNVLAGDRVQLREVARDLNVSTRTLRRRLADGNAGTGQPVRLVGNVAPATIRNMRRLPGPART